MENLYLFGRTIYADKITGFVLYDSGEAKTTMKDYEELRDDWNNIKALKERVTDAVIVIKLAFGKYSQDFVECSGYRINPETQELEFSYPDPNDPEPQEPVYQAPLSEKINENTDYLVDVDYRLSLVELGLNQN